MDSELKRTDPIDEHELKIINEACEKAHEILQTIPFREFKVRIIEI